MCLGTRAPWSERGDLPCTEKQLQLRAERGQESVGERCVGTAGVPSCAGTHSVQLRGGGARPQGEGLGSAPSCCCQRAASPGNSHQRF